MSNHDQIEEGGEAMATINDAELGVVLEECGVSLGELMFTLMEIREQAADGLPGYTPETLVKMIDEVIEGPMEKKDRWLVVPGDPALFIPKQPPKESPEPRGDVR